MPESEVRATIGQLRRAGCNRLLVVLTNGESLCTRLDEDEAGVPILEQDGIRFANYFHSSNGWQDAEVRLGYNVVAGLDSQRWERSEYRASIRGHPGSTPSSVSHAVDAGLAVGTALVSPLFQLFATIFNLSIKPPGPLRVGQRYGDNALLYADWEYFGFRDRGIDELGVGYGVSGSIGFKRSAWNTLYRTIRRRSVQIVHLCDGTRGHRSDGTVRGFGHMLDLSDLPKDHRETFERNMEDKNWKVIVVSGRRLTNWSELRGNPWSLVFFKPRATRFPGADWDTVENQVDFYGERVSATHGSSIGDQPYLCFLKLRAAAAV